MKRGVWGLALTVTIAVGGSLLYTRLAQPSTVLGAIARERPERVFAAQFSVPTRYHTCTATLPEDGSVPIETCGEGGDAPPRMGRLAKRGESLDPDTLHGSALVTIAWGKGDGTSLDDAIDRLNEALLFESDTVPLLVDLSAAYLARAQVMQRWMDLYQALDVAARATVADPRNKAAWWNTALAASALSMDDEATAAWKRYRELDPKSPWADEAGQRLSSLGESFARHDSTVSGADVEPLDTDAAPASPLRWDSILGEWGAAVLKGRPARADSLLALAESQGRGLARRGDESLADAVRDIRAVHDPRVKSRLADAHRVYSAAATRFPAIDTLGSETFAHVLELQPPSAALWAWAHAYQGVVKSSESKGATDSLLAQIDSLRYPLLTARVHWIRGRALFDDGKFADCEIHSRAAAQAFHRLGERDGYAATRSFEGWSRYEGGDTLAAYQYAQEALLSLRRAERSTRKHTLLVDMSQYVARQGMYHAAVVVANQVKARAPQLNDSARLAEAMLTRVRLGRLAGEAEPTSAVIDSVVVLIGRLPKSDDKNSLTNILWYTRAMQQPAGSMDSLVAAGLDSAIAYFSLDEDLWRTAALMRRADEHLHREDHARALADLNAIAAVFQRNAKDERTFYLRAAVMEEARERYDQLVMLHVRGGRPRDALEALDRGRVSLAPTGDVGMTAAGRLAGPRGESVVEYALIGDTLLAWTVRDTSVVLHGQPVDGDSLKRVIDRTRMALERKRGALAMPHLERLYDLLIRPVRDRLEPDSTLVIIADGEIAGLPFAALRDTERDTFLVQDHPIRYATTLAEARRPAPPAPLGEAVQALLVADPAFDEAEYDLDRLPGARAEMQSLLALYPGADTLAGDAATVGALLAKAPRANVIHYAGHAVFDDTRPEHSYLVLADSGSGGRLATDSVGTLDLGSVRIVVLSACSTLRGRRGRSGGFAGLSGALLSAGADGVVGSVWRVNDSLALPLMQRFHQEYRQSGDAAKALREAQLHMIREEHDLSAWAGFRSMGR